MATAAAYTTSSICCSKCFFVLFPDTSCNQPGKQNKKRVFPVSGLCLEEKTRRRMNQGRDEVIWRPGNYTPLAWTRVVVVVVADDREGFPFAFPSSSRGIFRILF